MGDSLDDQVDAWRAQHDESRTRRAAHREQAPKLLAQHGIAFEAKNNGAHLVVKHNGRVVDFWPGTGKFISRGKPAFSGRGIFALMRILRTVTP